MDAINNVLGCGENPDSDNLIASLFDEMGGLENLGKLQRHSNIEIYQKVITMMGKYYALEETDELINA